MILCQFQIVCPVAKSELIPAFQAESLAEQQEESAKEAFGNGDNCYSCHSYFAPFTQLFVKFDEDGLWNKEADGIQLDGGEFGRSKANLFASHFLTPERAKDEKAEIYKTEVTTLAEAAKVMVKQSGFKDCAIKNLLFHTLSITSVAEESVRAISAKTKKAPEEITFSEIAIIALTHPALIDAHHEFQTRKQTEDQNTH